MQRARLASLLVVSSLALPALAQSTWEYVGPPAISDWSAIHCQIAIASDGTPYVAFQDQSLASVRASVMQWRGGSWSYVGGKGNASLGQAYYDKIAIDAAGRPYVVCRDYAVNGKLNLRRYEPSSAAWLNVGTLGPSPGEAHYTDVAIAPDGTAAVVFADRTTTPADGASAMACTNGSWRVLGAFGFSGAGSGYSSVDVDAQGSIYAAFTDANYPDLAVQLGKATVMRYDDASNAWNAVGNGGFSPHGAANVTLRLDRTGAPWIAYYRWHSQIVVMRWTGAAWQQVGVSASGADRPEVQTESWRQWLSLDFDSQNRPYVAYQRYDDANRAAVRAWDGANWIAVGNLGFTPGAADYMAMAIGPDDVPYVVFRDAGNLQRVSVMRYAPSPYVYCTATVSSLGCTPQISASGTPSASSPDPFWIRATSVISHRSGLLLYSTGADRTPFLGGGVLCVRAPFSRGGVANSGGAGPGADCTGVLERDFNALIRAGRPELVPGARIFAQYYYRDQQGPNGPGLTDAVRFEIQP